MKKIAVAFVACLAFLSTSASAQVQKSDVDIKAPDGARLKGTYYSPGQSGPGVLLLHQCNMDRRSWDQLANVLGSSGFHVLTVDYRGYGESAEQTTDQERRRALRAKWPADVDAAFAYLTSQSGVDSSRLVVGGASCGVGQATDLASRRPAIKALIALSGSASDQGLAHVARTPGLAVFAAAAEGDANAAKGIRALVGASRYPQSMLKMYSGTEHGVPLFDKYAGLPRAIVSWLSLQVPNRGGTN